MDYSLPGSSDHGIFQAGILEWVAISFSRGSSRHRNRTPVSCTSSKFLHCKQILTNWAMREAHSCVRLFASPWTIQSMEFSRPEYWSRQPFPSPGDLPNPGIEPRSPALWVDSLPGEPQGNPKNIGVSSLSLLQWLFPIKESNWGLLHCRQIPTELSRKP